MNAHVHYERDIPDGLTFGGATALKRRVQAYWRERGHNPSVTVEQVPGMREHYQVRSDMIGGRPCSAV